MTFDDVVTRLDLKSVCLGGCGITVRNHKPGFLFLGSLHFAERRVSHRGLRNFLLLAVKRNRLANPEFLNSRRTSWYARWHDNVEAGRLAGLLGMRLPAALSLSDRRRCLVAARKAGVRLSVTNPTVYAWARKGMA